MIKTIDGIIEAARGGEPGIIAVAAAHDRPVIHAVAEARREGIAVPVLVGHADEIAAMLRELGEDPAAYEIIPGDTDTDCAAKAVALGEAMKPEFKAYQEQILKNAAALAKALMAEGFDLVSGGTDNHLCLVDLTPADVTGKDAEKLLESVGLTVNKNSIPNEPRSPFVTSGIRVGSAAATTRGFTADDFYEVGQLIAATVFNAESEAKLADVRAKVDALLAAHPLYPELDY